MRAFALYTLARVALFGVVFALVWAVGATWLVWDQVTVLWTALVALVLSSLAALVLLRRLRADLARHVEARARRVAGSIEQSRRSEDR